MTNVPLNKTETSTKISVLNLGLRAIVVMEKALHSDAVTKTLQMRPAQKLGLHLTETDKEALAVRALCQLSKITPRANRAKIQMLWLKRVVPLFETAPVHGIGEALEGLSSPALVDSADILLRARVRKLDRYDKIEDCNSILLRMGQKLAQNLPDNQLTLDMLGSTFFATNWNEWTYSGTRDRIVPALYAALDPKSGLVSSAAKLADKVIDSMVGHHQWESAFQLAQAVTTATASLDSMHKWIEVYDACCVVEPTIANQAFTDAIGPRGNRTALFTLACKDAQAKSNRATTCAMD